MKNHYVKFDEVMQGIKKLQYENGGLQEHMQIHLCKTCYDMIPIKINSWVRGRVELLNRAFFLFGLYNLSPNLTTYLWSLGLGLGLEPDPKLAWLETNSNHTFGGESDLIRPGLLSDGNVIT